MAAFVGAALLAGTKQGLWILGNHCVSASYAIACAQRTTACLVVNTTFACCSLASAILATGSQHVPLWAIMVTARISQIAANLFVSRICVFVTFVAFAEQRLCILSQTFQAVGLACVA
jgi:hypothetical protein